MSKIRDIITELRQLSTAVDIAVDVATAPIVPVYTSKTADYQALVKDYIRVDSTSEDVTISTPISPSDGEVFHVTLIAGTNDLVIDDPLTAVYVDGTSYTVTYTPEQVLGKVIKLVYNSATTTWEKSITAEGVNQFVVEKSSSLNVPMLSFNQIADASPTTGTTHNFDFSLGDMQQITCPAAGTLTIGCTNFPSGEVTTFIADLVNGGNCTITWNAAWLFAGGTAPTLTAAGTDRLLITKDKDDLYTVTVMGLDIKVVG